jgi:DNA transformation protein
MSVDRRFCAEVVRLLDPLGGVAARAMFGGFGLYLDGTMFGLITGKGVLCLRTDDGNRAAYEIAGMAPFKPFADRPMVMPYHVVPPAVLADPPALRAWAKDAWEAARRAAKEGKPRRNPRG